MEPFWSQCRGPGLTRAKVFFPHHRAAPLGRLAEKLNTIRPPQLGAGEARLASTQWGWHNSCTVLVPVCTVWSVLDFCQGIVTVNLTSSLTSACWRPVGKKGTMGQLQDIVQVAPFYYSRVKSATVSHSLSHSRPPVPKKKSSDRSLSPPRPLPHGNDPSSSPRRILQRAGGRRLCT